jgi:hypothetical protein
MGQGQQGFAGLVFGLQAFTLNHKAITGIRCLDNPGQKSKAFAPAKPINSFYAQASRSAGMGA